MVGLKADIGKERLLRLRLACRAAQVTEHAVDEELRGVIVLRHFRRPTIFVPIHLVSQGKVTLPRVPVVGATVRLNKRTVEATRRRQVVAFMPHMPLARGIGAVARRLQAARHRHHIAVEHREVAGAAQVFPRDGLPHIAYAIAMVVHAREQHGASG